MAQPTVRSPLTALTHLLHTGMSFVFSVVKSSLFWLAMFFVKIKNTFSRNQPSPDDDEIVTLRDPLSLLFHSALDVLYVLCSAHLRRRTDLTGGSNEDFYMPATTNRKGLSTSHGRGPPPMSSPSTTWSSTSGSPRKNNGYSLISLPVRLRAIPCTPERVHRDECRADVRVHVFVGHQNRREGKK